MISLIVDRHDDDDDGHDDVGVGRGQSSSLMTDVPSNADQRLDSLVMQPTSSSFSTVDDRYAAAAAIPTTVPERSTSPNRSRTSMTRMHEGVGVASSHQPERSHSPDRSQSHSFMMHHTNAAAATPAGSASQSRANSRRGTANGIMPLHVAFAGTSIGASADDNIHTQAAHAIPVVAGQAQQNGAQATGVASRPMALSSARSIATAESTAQPTTAIPTAIPPAASTSSHSSHGPPILLSRAATMASPSPSSAAAFSSAQATRAASVTFSAVPPVLLRTASMATSGTNNTNSTNSTLLTWVCQTNRDLIRTFFAKKTTTTQRGILESPLQGDLLLTPFNSNAAAAAAAASGSKHKKSSSSSSAVPLFALGTQLINSVHTPALHHAYQIALYGSPAVGKTSTIANLTSRIIPPKHMETAGMQIMDISWPYKVRDTNKQTSRIQQQR